MECLVAGQAAPATAWQGACLACTGNCCVCGTISTQSRKRPTYAHPGAGPHQCPCCYPAPAHAGRRGRCRACRVPGPARGRRARHGAAPARAPPPARSRRGRGPHLRHSRAGPAAGTACAACREGPHGNAAPAARQRRTRWRRPGRRGGAAAKRDRPPPRRLPLQPPRARGGPRAIEDRGRRLPRRRAATRARRVAADARRAASRRLARRVPRAAAAARAHVAGRRAAAHARAGAGRSSYGASYVAAAACVRACACGVSSRVVGGGRVPGCAACSAEGVGRSVGGARSGRDHRSARVLSRSRATAHCARRAAAGADRPAHDGAARSARCGAAAICPSADAHAAGRSPGRDAALCSCPGGATGARRSLARFAAPAALPVARCGGGAAAGRCAARVLTGVRCSSSAAARCFPVA